MDVAVDLQRAAAPASDLPRWADTSVPLDERVEALFAASGRAEHRRG